MFDCIEKILNTSTFWEIHFLSVRCSDGDQSRVQTA